jgi:hypothetical protein
MADFHVLTGFPARTSEADIRAALRSVNLRIVWVDRTHCIVGPLKRDEIDVRPWCWEPLRAEQRALIDSPLTFVMTPHVKTFTPTCNPPLVISECHVQGATLRVVRDDLLPGGTKQRGIIACETGAEELVYASMPFGYAQVALAYVGAQRGKLVTIFCGDTPANMTLVAARWGAKIIQCPSWDAAKKSALKYAAGVDCPHRRTQVPFGIDTPDFIRILAMQIRTATPADFVPPKRIWIASGSGTLARALAEVWPNATLVLVQVGRALNSAHRVPVEIFVAPEAFAERARDPPPYPSAAHYDAKVWQFVKLHGRAGDLIWNVG